MVKRSYKPEEVVAKLRQADVLRSQGMTIADVSRPTRFGTVDK